MNRITRPRGNHRLTVLGAIVLLAVTTSSVSAADGGTGPLGVTAEAAVDSAGSRVGALFEAGDALAAAAVVGPHVAVRHLLGDGLETRADALRSALAEIVSPPTTPAPRATEPRNASESEIASGRR